MFTIKGLDLYVAQYSVDISFDSRSKFGQRSREVRIKPQKSKMCLTLLRTKSSRRHLADITTTQPIFDRTLTDIPTTVHRYSTEMKLEEDAWSIINQ